MLFDERVRPEYPRKISQESVKNHKRNPRMTCNPRIYPGLHWWKASACSHHYYLWFMRFQRRRVISQKKYVRIHDKCELYSFTELTCRIYEAPVNGALVIRYFGPDPLVQVQCKSGYDFVTIPPLLYICALGEWTFIDLFGTADTSLPWPNCTSKHFKN